MDAAQGTPGDRRWGQMRHIPLLSSCQSVFTRHDWPRSHTPGSKDHTLGPRTLLGPEIGDLRCVLLPSSILRLSGHLEQGWVSPGQGQSPNVSAPHECGARVQAPRLL